MQKRKPLYLGRVIPEDPPKIKTFLEDKYEKFSEAYDTIKGSSDQISDIRDVSSDENSFSLKVTCSDEALAEIAERVAERTTMILENDILTVKNEERIVG